MRKEYSSLIFTPGQFQLTKGFRTAIEAENEKEPLIGTPEAKFDEKRNVPYLLFPDGRKIYEMPD